MSYQKDVQDVLDDSDDTAEAASTIYKGPRAVALYVILLGLEAFKSKYRRKRRRELKADVRPQFKAGAVTGSVVFTDATKKRLADRTRDLFGKDGWMIGELNLGAMTKEQLIAQASNEEASAKGLIQNARFYRALAEPLEPGQRADAYWNKSAGLKLKAGIWKDTEGQRPTLS